MHLFVIAVGCCDFYLALDDNAESYALFSFREDLSSSFKVFLVQVELHLVVEILTVHHLREVVHLLQDRYLEFLPGVLVFQRLLLHLDEDIWEAATEVVKNSLVNAGHRAVVGTHY